LKALSEIPINSVKQIHSFTCQIIARKLITMGVVPGKEIEIIRKTGFGKTFLVRVEDSHFALRQNEAANILIKN